MAIVKPKKKLANGTFEDIILSSNNIEKDTAVTSGSTKPVTSGAVASALTSKQNKLTSSSIPDGTIVKALGFDNSNNLVQGAGGSADNKLDKTTFEWNREISFGAEGYLKIGSFPMYDTNVTIEINSTTNITYHGTLVIATQNVTTTSMGTACIEVYDDPTGEIAKALSVVYTSGSRNYDVYFVPSAWSKNLIHIQAVNLQDNATDICVSQSGTAPTSTSGLTPVNKLQYVYMNMAPTSDKGASLGSENNRFYYNYTYRILGCESIEKSTSNATYRLTLPSKAGVIAITDDFNKANLFSILGLGTLNTSNGWGTVTSGNGYTMLFGGDQPSGGGLEIGEKDGQTHIQIDGDYYGREGAYKCSYMDYSSQSGSFYATNIYASSDKRLKKNIKDNTFDSEAILDSMKIKQYVFKNDKNNQTNIGIIAQELQDILPDELKGFYVQGEETEEGHLSVNDSKFVYLLIDAYQKEKAKRIKLENKLNNIEERLRKLEEN